MNSPFGIQCRFLSLFASRLHSRNSQVGDHLWFHPDEEKLNDRRGEVLDEMDLARHPEHLREALEVGGTTAIPDFDGEVLPWLRQNLVLVRIGGLGSHLIKARPFQELDALNGEVPLVFDLMYGNTASCASECLLKAKKAVEDIVKQAGGRGLLFLSHSRGSNIALDLTVEDAADSIRDSVRGIISFAGAIGGSPAADGALAAKIKSLPALLENSPWAAPLQKILPTLSSLPDALSDLSPSARQQRLRSIQWPKDKLFLSIAAVSKPGQPRPIEQLAGSALTQRFVDFAGYDLSPYSYLNDTQVLLRDAKWPEVAGGHHLATVKTDHWGIVYERLLPLLAPDPTPRRALYEAALMQFYEMAQSRI